jgi:hypothetical protein
MRPGAANRGGKRAGSSRFVEELSIVIPEAAKRLAGIHNHGAQVAKNREYGFRAPAYRPAPE